MDAGRYRISAGGSGDQSSAYPSIDPLHGGSHVNSTAPFIVFCLRLRGLPGVDGEFASDSGHDGVGVAVDVWVGACNGGIGMVKVSISAVLQPLELVALMATVYSTPGMSLCIS